MSQLTTPVAFVVFNRPETTARVWEAIRQARPRTLLIIADGPRPRQPGEAERCFEVRAICERVDWPCDVRRNYSDVNLGCAHRPKTGWDWVFENVEEAICLEDDCIPHPTFFSYCQELLKYYRDDKRVMLISGNNFLPGPPRTDYSYYFSRLPYTWGWAAWRRTWRMYDMKMTLWPQIRDGDWLRGIVGSTRQVRYWRAIFDRAASQQWDVWDYQLFFTCFINSGLTIFPSANLVANVGFGADATHTVGGCAVTNAPVKPMDFPLRHPPFVIPDLGAEEIMSSIVFRGQSPLAKAALKTKAILRRTIGDRLYLELKRRMRGSASTQQASG
jgi:hypothetical protein